MARILIVDDNAELGALIAGALADRSHAPIVCARGGEARAAILAGDLDAAVVDLHLPDLPGTELLALLRDRGTPAVAVSGVFRGAAFEARITQALGARALFEKPFELSALVEAVAASVAPANDPPVASDVPELVLNDAIEAEPSPGPRAPKPPLEDLPFSGRSVWAADGARPDTGPNRAVGARAAPLGPEARDLADTSVPRLLCAAYQSRATGELRLRRGPIIKVIWLSDGRPIYAASNAASERFGRFAVAQGALAAGDLGTVAELTVREKVKTGDAMVRLGLITAAQRVALLHGQALQIMSSTFDWPDGEHRFIHRAVGKPDVVPLDLDLPAVLLQGFARLPLVRLRERVPSALVPSPTPDPAIELHALDLAPPQAHLVLAADGTKRVEDLLVVSELEERPALALLLTLLELRVLAPRAAGAERGAASAERRIVLV